jgi:formylmethanofuran dehydrogenase subunit E
MELVVIFILVFGIPFWLLSELAYAHKKKLLDQEVEQATKRLQQAQENWKESNESLKKWQEQEKENIRKRAELVAKGKAAYFVKIAPSGKGSVYHNLSCGRCDSYLYITETQAINKGYYSCSVCGGEGTFMEL